MRQLVQEMENTEFKPVKLRLKIDLVLYPARAEGLINMITVWLVFEPTYFETAVNNFSFRAPPANNCNLF